MYNFVFVLFAFSPEYNAQKCKINIGNIGIDLLLFRVTGAPFVL